MAFSCCRGALFILSLQSGHALAIDAFGFARTMIVRLSHQTSSSTMTSTIHDQECPLCQKPARFQLVNFDDWKHFQCGHCPEFQISTGAEERLAESIPEWRAQLSEQARRAPKDQVLVITLPSGPPDESVAYPELKQEYVLRQELPGQQA
jgi:hypothetical protein